MFARGLLLTSLAVMAISMDTLHEHPGHVTTLPGAVMEYLGRVYPVTSFLEVRYSLSPIMGFRKQLVDQLHHLIRFRESLTSHPPLQPHHFRILSQSLIRLEKKISSFLHQKSLPVNSTRSRRGLLNFVGVLSHTLFGTIDEQTFENRMREYQNKLESVSTSFDASAHAITSLTFNVEQLGAAVQYLRANAAQASALDSVERFTRTAFLISQYQITFAEVSAAAIKFHASIISAAHGIVDQTLLSPRDIESVLGQVTENHGLRPLFQTSTPVLLYATLSSYLTRKGLSILIPLHPPIILSAYAIHPFPHSHNGTLLILNSPSLVLTALTSHSLTPSYGFAFPPHSLFDACQTPILGTYVCLAPAWPYNANTHSCTHSLLSHRHNIHKTCTFSEHIPSQSPFVLPLQSVTLLYFYEPTPSTISCPSPRPMSSLSGPFILPHKCGLQSIQLTFPAIKHYSTSFSKHIQFDQPGPLTPFTLPTHLSQLNLTLKRMDVVKPLPWSATQHPVFIYGYPVAITVFGVVLLAGAMVGFTCYIRRVNHNLKKKANTIYPSLD